MTDERGDGVGAGAAGRIALGGELTVNRLGFGAMRITGPGVWGDPPDPDQCVAVLRRAVELGVDFIDTADSYGPFVSEDLIARALHPYPEGLVIATKGGLTRSGPGVWEAVGRPEYLRQCVEMSLRRLRLERIDLFQFHRPDPVVPFEESVGALGELRAAGKIRLLGLSNVSVAQLESAVEVLGGGAGGGGGGGGMAVASVQNRFNLADRSSDPVLAACERSGIAFIPWAPVGAGGLAGRSGGGADASPDAAVGQLMELATRLGVSAGQLSLAWTLQRSPVMLPIPGTSQLAHLEENVGAAAVAAQLTDAQWESLDAAF